MYQLCCFWPFNCLSVFSQSNQEDPCRPVKVENLTKDLLPLPFDKQRNNETYFKFKVNSISDASIEFYDQYRSPLYKVVISGDPIERAAKFEIVGMSKMAEWVSVKYIEEDGKQIAKAVSSSGRSIWYVLSTNGTKGNAKKISSISVTVENDEKSSSEAVSITEDESERLKEVGRLEDRLYDTPALKELQIVLSSLDELQRILLRASTTSQTSELPLPEGMPDCHVYCQRIGTVIPIYACSDDALNCSRCGVDGFYYLGGHGCIIICILHCREFWV